MFRRRDDGIQHSLDEGPLISIRDFKDAVFTVLSAASHFVILRSIHGSIIVVLLFLRIGAP